MNNEDVLFWTNTFFASKQPHFEFIHDSTHRSHSLRTCTRKIMPLMTLLYFSASCLLRYGSDRFCAADPHALWSSWVENYDPSRFRTGVWKYLSHSRRRGHDIVRGARLWSSHEPDRCDAAMRCWAIFWLCHLSWEVITGLRWSVDICVFIHHSRSYRSAADKPWLQCDQEWIFEKLPLVLKAPVGEWRSKLLYQNVYK